MEDTGVPRENVLYVLVANHRYILCCIEYTSPWAWFDLTTFRHYWSTICFQFKFQWYPSYNQKRFCLFEVLTLMFHCLFTSILPIYQTEMVRIQRQTVHTDAFGQFPVGHPDKQHINEQQVDLLGGRCPGRFKAWSTPVRISLIFLAHPYVNHLDFHQHICRRSILCSLIINKIYW